MANVLFEIIQIRSFRKKRVKIIIASSENTDYINHKGEVNLHISTHKFLGKACVLLL